MKAALIAGTLLAAAGCYGSESTLLAGSARPARPEGCDVTVLPGRQPDFPVVDVATARAWCGARSRSDCIDELRNRACAAGAEIVYGFSESVDKSITYISATIAYRDTARAAHPATVAATAPGECSPPCSPGFACHAGTCIPQCNPPCEASEVCDRHRTCERAAPAAAAPAIPAPPAAPATPGHP